MSHEPIQGVLLSLEGLPKLEGQRCRACDTFKLWEAFARESRNRMGYRYECSDCVNRKRRAEHQSCWQRKAAIAARARAKAAGVPFDATAIMRLETPERCPVLGIPLAVSSGCWKDGSPTVDRIRPERGYVHGNLRVISHRANRIKSNVKDPAEFEAVIAYIRREETQ